MSDTVTLADILRAAGERCAGYMIQYGVVLEWTITEIGLKLSGQCGADKCQRTLFYSDMVLPGREMRELEQQVLRGLSS